MSEASTPITITDLPDDIRESLKGELLELRQADKGFTKEQAKDYAKAWLDGFSNPSLAGVFADGVMLGFADDAKGVAKASINYLFGDGTKSRLTETGRARGQQAGARWQRPNVSTAVGIAGSVAPALAGGAGALALAGRGAAKAAPGVLAQIGRGAAAGTAGGAAGGAAYGAGSAKGGLDERLTGAAEGAIPGAVAGAALGGAAVPVARVAQGIGRRVSSALTGRGGRAHAQRKVAEALDDAGLTADQVADRVTEAQAMGVPFKAADAMGQPGRDLLDAALATPGKARADASAALSARQRGQAGRLNDATARITGVNEGSASARLAAKDAARAETGPAYEALNDIVTPQGPADMLRRMMQNKAWRDAYEDAAEDINLRYTAGELPRRLPPMEEFLNGGAEISARETDLILQGVQRQVKARQTGGILPGDKANTGGPRGSHGLNSTAEMIRDAMAKEVPEFGAARAAAKAGLDFEDGAKLGGKFFDKGKTVDELTAVWNRASPEKRKGIRQGMVSGLRAKLEGFTTGASADASRIVNGPGGIKAKLRVVLGDRQADELLRQFATEGETSATAALPFNSATARRGNFAADLEGEPMEGLNVSPQGILTRVLGSLDRASKRRMYAELGRIGLLDDPAEIRRQLVQSQRRLPQLVAPSRVGIGVGVPLGPTQHQIRENRK